MNKIKPVAYFRATKKRGIIWSEDCCCADPVFDDDYDDGYDGEDDETFSLPVYSAAAYEALQKENAELRERVKTLLGVIAKRYTDILELNKKLSATIAENEAQLP